MTHKVSDLENKDLQKEVKKDSEFKDLIVDYIGEQKCTDDNIVTLQMVVNTFAEEFPEFVLALAEENWLRGYTQGVADSGSATINIENKDEINEATT